MLLVCPVIMNFIWRFLAKVLTSLSYFLRLLWWPKSSRVRISETVNAATFNKDVRFEVPWWCAFSPTWGNRWLETAGFWISGCGAVRNLRCNSSISCWQSNPLRFATVNWLIFSANSCWIFSRFRVSHWTASFARRNSARKLCIRLFAFWRTANRFW